MAFLQTLETTDWGEVKQKENDLIALAKQAKLASSMTAEFSRLLFSQALDRYLAERAVETQAEVKLRKSWEGRLTGRLRPFFTAKRLNQISADDIRQYQADGLGRGKNPNTVNHEVKVLLQLLKLAKLASRLRDDVRLLPMKREPRTMLTEAEKQGLFETASTETDWQTAYCATYRQYAHAARGNPTPALARLGPDQSGYHG